MISLWTWSAAVATIGLMVANSLLVASVSVHLGPGIVLSAELVKFSVSLIFVVREGVMPQATQPLLVEFFRLMVPALIYAINNNLIIRTSAVIGPVNMQAVSQVRVLMTGLLSFFFLGKRLSLVQWTGLIVLMFGVASKTITDDFTFSMPLSGFLAGLSVCFLSSCAGVFTEWCYKFQVVEQSIWLKNVQLYFHGIWLNVVWKTVTSGNVSILQYDDLTPIVLMAVANQALMGIAIGFLLKLQSAIVKNYLASIALVCVGLIGVVFWSEPLRFGLITCVALTFSAACLHAHRCES